MVSWSIYLASQAPCNSGYVRSGIKSRLNGVKPHQEYQSLLIPNTHCTYAQHNPARFPTTPSTSNANILEWIVLWRYLMYEVVSNDRHLLHDILPYFRNLSEEEEGENACNGAESTSCCAAKIRRIVSSIQS